MGSIIISENVSLDGVIEDPTGEGDLGRGSWFDHVGDRDREAWAHHEYQEAVGAAALLMGRRSYDWFIERGWRSRTGAWADRLRDLAKYVVSSTPLADPGWINACVLKGEVTTEISRLKDTVDGDIVVYGSGQLAQVLMQHDLVDELRLIGFPVVVGAGERLFAATSSLRPLRLVDLRTVGEGLTLRTYRRG